MLFSFGEGLFSSLGLGMMEGVGRLLQHHSKVLVFMLMSLNSIMEEVPSVP